MSPYKTPDEEEVDRINRLQRKLFDELYHLFDPPLPEGVPERLERIVASAEITSGDNVLDVGSGTGILVPLIKKYGPARLFACDLSEAMLRQLKKHYPDVEAIVSDIRELAFPDLFLDVVFINACYPNIVDKVGAFTNLGRMTRAAGRMVISHPLGKAFIDSLKEKVPFPLDDFPEKPEAETLFKRFGFGIKDFLDDPELYILVVTKQN
jgi:ubiquinone/menaquinone biosynthesis C-methylase UbiE